MEDIITKIANIWDKWSQNNIYTHDFEEKLRKVLENAKELQQLISQLQKLIEKAKTELNISKKGGK